MKNIVITIGREYGSGGHEVGARLAERLDIPFYDEELVDLAAEKSGCCPDFVRKNDEKTPGIFARTSIMPRGTAYGHLTPEDELFISQTAIINELAGKGACVIVGRCADYVLRERTNTINIFIYAPLDARVSRKLALGADGKTEKDVKKKIVSTDKQREKYYNFYTGEKWGNSRNYDICIDTSMAGIDGTVDLIIDFIYKVKNKGILPDR